MKITQSPTFGRSVKKLHANQKKSLDKAVSAIAKDSSLGEQKVGDLAGISIFKCKINGLEWLLVFRVISKKEIKLLVIGPHENFYRDLKRLS
jgi:mRNA-degrading endonuclease YafQ of YafQ-DinJ toxin-antitoxin module